MNLLNHTLKYLSVALLLILTVWAVVFYINMLDEVYDSIDDGLENYKMLIIEKAQSDSTLLHQTHFDERNYAIREISETAAMAMHDTYCDTAMYMRNEEDFEPVRLLTTAFTQGGRYYELRVVSSMVEEDDLIEDLLYALVWLYVILLVTVLLVNNVLLRRIWKPFYHLLGQLKRFRVNEETDVEVEETSVKEFKELNETVKSLIHRVSEAFQSQKQFIENASHELQTPLAICINKLELMAEKDEMDETTLGEIGQVISVLERLTRLNQSLLLLSKIENHQFDTNEEVDMAALTERLIGEFSDLAVFKQVEVKLTREGTPRVQINPDLATILVSNLLKNALVHNRPEGRVEVLLSASELVVRNTATGGPMDEAKLFQRFGKGSGEKAGTGLGLAISQAIAARFSVALSYTFENEMHIFSLRFPMRQSID